jgi:hypothetical protein
VRRIHGTIINKEKCFLIVVGTDFLASTCSNKERRLREEREGVVGAVLADGRLRGRVDRSSSNNSYKKCCLFYWFLFTLAKCSINTY